MVKRLGKYVYFYPKCMILKYSGFLLLFAKRIYLEMVDEIKDYILVALV